MVKIEKISPHEVDFERITKLTALEKKEIVNCLGEEKNVLDVLLTPSEYVDLISEQLGLNSVCRDYFDYRQFLIDQNEGYGNVITLQIDGKQAIVILEV